MVAADEQNLKTVFKTIDKVSRPCQIDIALFCANETTRIWQILICYQTFMIEMI